MESTGIISGDTNRLQTSAVRHTVDDADSQATEVACESA
ncbi:MAG: hypothetical protein E5299_01329 [Burkholderia gladioli]|nr:MAG: hypothetical protein E5299_01329 [Burkholderia gladioli]